MQSVMHDYEQERIEAANLDLPMFFTSLRWLKNMYPEVITMPAFSASGPIAKDE